MRLIYSVECRNRNLAYIRKLNGVDTSDDLIGIDKPDDVDKLYKEKEDWINNYGNRI